MRFRYFDSEGTEVGVSSVDALRFRIQKGVVTPETLLYDAAAGIWSPARQNPLFRFLVEEEDLLPPEMRPLMEEDDPTSEGAAGFDAPGRRWTDAARKVDFPDLDGALDVDLPEGEGERHVSPDVRSVESESDPGRVGRPSASEPSASEPEPGMGAVEASGAESGAEEGEEAVEPRTTEEDEESGGWASDDDWAVEIGADWSEQPRDVGVTSASGHSWRGRPAEPAATSGRGDARRRSAAARARKDRAPWWRSARKEPSVPRTGSDRRRRRPPSLAGVAVLSILVAFLVGVPIFVLGGEGGGEAGSAYALVGSLAGDLMGGGKGDDDASSPDEEPGGSGADTREGSDAASGESSLRGAGSTGELDTDRVEALAVEVEAAASRDLATALAELRVGLAVPESPPDIWLRGRYLAAADSFPEVAEYWRAFSSYVESMEELEGELFRGYVEDRVLEMSLDSVESSRLAARALERYEGAAPDRWSAYRDLSALASNALTLHDTLAARSDQISYEPFDGTGLSRDPVIEAVAEDPELAERIWSRLDRTLDLVESLQGLRPVSTSQLQAALLGTPGGLGGIGGVDGARDGSPPD